MDSIYILAEEMKILIDENIPYVEHFFHDYLDDIEYFKDKEFEINMVKEDSVVITRSTYKTHGKKISKAVKFLCSASTGEDHFDKKILDNMNIPYAFSTGANAIAVAEYTFSTLALMLKERKFYKDSDAVAVIGCGNIGSKVMKTLDAFNFEVYGYDPFNTEWLANKITGNSSFAMYSGAYAEAHGLRGLGWDISLREFLDGTGSNFSTINPTIKFVSLNVPLHEGYKVKHTGAALESESLSKKQLKNIFVYSEFDGCSKIFPTKNLIDKQTFAGLPCGAIILNTSRGGVVSEKDFLEFDGVDNYIELISDVFENEPNINEDFLNKNLFATPHIAGHSQFARYQMTKMAYENVMNFLGQDIIERNSVLENRIIYFEKNIFDKDMEEFGLPVTLILDTYNPKSDIFNYKDFKKVRDNYNNRIGYSQVIIKGCSDEADRENLKSLGFTVEEN